MELSGLPVDGALLKGAVLGVSIAAPVGPIGLLCLRRAVTHGVRAGVLSGMGAATADFGYGVLAVMGVTLAAQWHFWLRLVGALLLLFLAARAWRDAVNTPTAAAQPAAERGLFLSTFLLTASNPMTILSFVALVAGLSVGSPWWFVAGVWVGSMAWWLVLSVSAGALRSRLNPAAMRQVSRAAALVLAGFGLAALWQCYASRG